MPASRTTAISPLRPPDGVPGPTHVRSDAVLGSVQVPDWESAHTHTSLRVAVSAPPSTALPVVPDRSSKQRAELARRLAALQRTRSAVLSSQTTSRRTRSELSSDSESGTEVAIRNLEAEMAQLRGVLSALNVRLADGGHSEPLPAYAE